MTGYSEALSAEAAHGFPVLGKPFGQRDVALALQAARAERVARPAAE